jgi:hypothetical protein
VRPGRALVLLVLLGCVLPGCLTTGEQPAAESDEATQPTQVTTVAPVTLPPETTAVTPLPTILPIRGGQPALRLSFSFSSGGDEQLVILALDQGAFPALEGEEACPLASWRAGDEERLAAYYAVTFKDPDLDVLYIPLLFELRRIQRMEGLNDDEYLELMVHFVQSIPYDPDAPVCPRNPPQVILDRKGDCDEKSILLLGLLYREGYDAAILIFPEKHHATAGIRIDVSNKPSFRVFDLRGRKYVYIETTRPSFIGLYPDEFWTQDPVIIPTGNGTKTYRAINDVMHIVSIQKRMEEKLGWYNETGTGMLTEILALEEKLSAGTGYSTQDEYDTDYARYTTLVNRYNQYVGEFRTIRDVYLYIISHQDDREGVNGRIANSKVENVL